MKMVVVAIGCVLIGYALGFTQGKFTTYGQGNESCGEWTAQNKVRRDTHQFTWVVGFVSGAGFASTRTQKPTDSSGIAAWIDTYCAANPLDSIAKASGNLVVELETRR